VISYWWYRTKPYLWLWTARLVPRSLRYWVVIQSISEATTGPYSNTVVPELTAMDMLKRIEPGKVTGG
jgi:hypothetical protein